MSFVPLLVAGLTFVAVLAVSERRDAARPARRIAPYVRARTSARADLVAPTIGRPYARTERQLSRLPGWKRFETLVERSRPGAAAARMFWICAGGVGGIGLFALAIGASFFVSVVVLVLSVAAVRSWFGATIERRRRAFDDQLPELLGELAAALRAGHGFNQALQAVAGDAAEPAATELGRVLTETRLGRPLEDALSDLGARVRSRDLDFVLEAIVVQRQVGGSLAGIFAIVGEAVRQRHQYALRLRSLTATGRVSAIVLLTLPLALGLLLSLMNHQYFAPLERTASGRLMVGSALALLAIGAVWLRRVVPHDGAAS
jgi:tight adherence protein B